ncbi:MAG: DNA-formamidopyrimidine glycosylase family protein [Verrucomicrobiota bacterium]
MPELAEVEYYRKRWNPGLGQSITRVTTHPKSRIYRDLPATAVKRGLGTRGFIASHAHGKQMLFQFGDGAWLGLHLGMTGKLHTRTLNSAVEKHDHLVIELSGCQLVFTDPRMFGKLSLDVTKDKAPPQWWQSLPPQPHEAGFTLKAYVQFSTRFPKTPIKTLLLDQRGFPGVGNWMADEICWRSGIAPQTRVGDLTEEQHREIWRRIRQVSRDALRVIGVDWKTPPRSWLFTHRWKDGGSCPRRDCSGDLLRVDLRGRTTCWCPECQA